jgi:K+-transporting ATPase KdpF subunit
MSGFEWLGAALAVGLLVYLFIALLAPEKLS